MNIMAIMPQLKTTVLDLLFPLNCIGCGHEGELICTSCQQSLSWIRPPLCSKCGIVTDGDDVCSVCRQHPPVADGIRSLFIFEGIIRDAVHQLKYKRLKAMSVPLGRFLAEYLLSNQVPADVLVPVPLHPKRLRERGYNQASLLAYEAGKRSNIPVSENSIRRTKNTSSQAKTTSAQERRANVRDAFICTQKLNGKNVLLIDDVCTTGATLNACAVSLKEAGADSVWGLTIARDIV